MRTVLFTVTCAVSLTLAGSATGQLYPSRPITIISAAAPGGPSDTIARLMAEPLRVSLGQPVIVENIPGASGSIGVGRVARAAPDGYTISIGLLNTHVLNGAVYRLPYDVLNDFEPVALLASTSQLIVSKNAIPAKNLTDLIAWLRANPDKASAATGGPGSASHLAGVLFQNITGSRFQFVPYRGGAPAMQDLVAGHVDLFIDQSANALPHVRSGKIKAYAVTAKTRLAWAPDIPTVDEAGLPGFYVSNWHGFWVPKGTPKDVIAKLNAAVVDALADPIVRQRFTDRYYEIPPPDQQTPDALRAHQKAEIAKWWPIVKAANINAD